jgi:hypothetical protein
MIFIFRDERGEGKVKAAERGYGGNGVSDVPTGPGFNKCATRR